MHNAYINDAYILYIFKIAGFCFACVCIYFGSIFIATFDVCSVGIGSHVSLLPILPARVALRVCDIILLLTGIRIHTHTYASTSRCGINLKND